MFSGGIERDPWHKMRQVELCYVIELFSLKYISDFFVLQGNRFGTNEPSEGECIRCIGIGHEVNLHKDENDI